MSNTLVSNFIQTKFESREPKSLSISKFMRHFSYRLQVRPVLKRAGSVKQIGNAVLDSRVSTYAVDRIEGALDVADKYIDKYLPPNAQDQTDCESIITFIFHYFSFV